MARTIRVDDDVYGWLQARAKPFEDSPNSVLRRVIGLDVLQTDKETTEKGTAGGKTAREKAGGEKAGGEKPGPAAEEEAGAKAGGSENAGGASADRFRKGERKRAKTAAEATLGFKLKRASDDPRIFTDPEGHLYVLAGGRDRIALPAETMVREDARAPEARLLIALSGEKTLRIFAIPLAALVHRPDRLAPGGDGDVLIHISGSQTEAPVIAEQPDLLLAPLAEA